MGLFDEVLGGIGGQRRYGASTDPRYAGSAGDFADLHPVRVFNGIFKPQRNKDTDRIEYKYDTSQDPTYQALVAEVNAQYGGGTRRGNDTMNLAEMRELMATIEVPNGVKVTSPSPGEYVFSYRGDDNAKKPLKIDADAVQLAASSGKFDWQAPLPSTTMAPTSATLGTTINPVTAEKKLADAEAVVAPVKAVTEPLAVETVKAVPVSEGAADPKVLADIIPAASGPAARRYNSATMPEGLTQNMVLTIQQRLMDEGLSVGARAPDGKWGKATQASYEQFCKDIGVDPKAVNLSDANDPETKKLAQAFSDRDAARKATTAKFIADMDVVIANLDKPAETQVADAKEAQALTAKAADQTAVPVAKSEPALMTQDVQAQALNAVHDLSTPVQSDHAIYKPGSEVKLQSTPGASFNRDAMFIA